MIYRAFVLILLLVTAAFSWPAGAGAFPANFEQNAISAAAHHGLSAPLPRVNVAIQAGHWKSAELPDELARLRGSTGTSGGGRAEPQLTLDIAQRVARILKDKGLSVEVLPATVPTGYQADLFISLHADGNSSLSARGYKLSTRWRSDVAALDALLVQSINSGYGSVTGLPVDPSITRAMRGYYAFSTYYGDEYRLSGTTPAALLEMGFMSNAADRAVMFNKPDLVAQGIATGISNYYANRPSGLKLQAAAAAQAAASPYGRAVVVMQNSANIRAGAAVSSAKLLGAAFGASFPLLEPAPPHPTKEQIARIDPRQGTRLVSAAGWYKIVIPGKSSPSYISRDTVVVQE